MEELLEGSIWQKGMANFVPCRGVVAAWRSELLGDVKADLFAQGHREIRPSLGAGTGWDIPEELSGSDTVEQSNHLPAFDSSLGEQPFSGTSADAGMVDVALGMLVEISSEWILGQNFATGLLVLQLSASRGDRLCDGNVNSANFIQIREVRLLSFNEPVAAIKYAHNTMT